MSEGIVGREIEDEHVGHRRAEAVEAVVGPFGVGVLGESCWQRGEGGSKCERERDMESVKMSCDKQDVVHSYKYISIVLLFQLVLAFITVYQFIIMPTHSDSRGLVSHTDTCAASPPRPHPPSSSRSDGDVHALCMQSKK